jgi:hypothetical protein
MKIVVDENGKKYNVEESALTPVQTGPRVQATVLKSLRTESGAKDYAKLMSAKYPGAIVVKSLGGYEECVDLGGAPMPPMPAMTHVIIEKDLAPIAEVVSVKNSDELVRAMIKKGLLTAENGGIFPSSEFYEILGKFSEAALNDYMKAVDPEADKTDAGVPMIDVVTEYIGVLKSAGKLGLSQEEADNKHGDTRTESLGDQKTAAGPEGSPEAKTSTGTDADPPKLGLDQEEADNKNGDGRTTAISDGEAKGKFGDVQITKSVPETYFTALADAKHFIRKNADFYLDSPKLDETEEYGKKYKYVARKYEKKEFTGFGNRKVKK